MDLAARLRRLESLPCPACPVEEQTVIVRDHTPADRVVRCDRCGRAWPRRVIYIRGDTLDTSPVILPTPLP